MDSQPNRNAGTGQLFVVATPIGNLGDISYRAVEILKKADAIAAEDTRTSARLLSHYGIATPMFACHEHNEEALAEQLLARLRQGQDIALISDAGTPLISDPGFKIVRTLRRAGIRITPVPGPCSPIVALSASGLPTDRFTYLGFLPRAGSKREAMLRQIAAAEHTHILLESPHRLVGTLRELQGHLRPEHEMCVAREMTKMFEEFVYGTGAEVVARFEAEPPRGEIVLIIGPAPEAGEAIDDAAILARLHAPDMHSLPPSTRARSVAKELGVPKSRVYRLLTDSGA
ncbi:MAG TPA: 16S rRNA (cytidine(1402)-2'-O)-methyltransferase [Mariprofundaceae bacterium]|nr:16S rRNA (cytidine(1402)-2'-O)-methyltransferase [Mariprofundaceae bacterium]